MIEFNENTDSLFALESVERHEAVIPITEIDFKMKYKDNCLSCPEYGKNLSCPPFSPGFHDFVGNLNRAKVICLRMPLHLLGDLPEKERPRAAYDRLSLLLAGILTEEREKGYKVAGAGACNACRVCPIEKGDMICIKPEEQIFSLESMGVNISALLERCFDIKLEWSESRYEARHICAVGACFY